MIDTRRILEGEITPSILAEKRGAVGWLTFNDPARPTISEAPPHAHPAS